MGASIFPCWVPALAGTVEFPAQRGVIDPRFLVMFGQQRLPTDAQGQAVVTLTNVVVGSRYRIERQGDGSLATPTGNAEGVAAASTVNITLDYYSGGSVNNDLRIKVRKATGGSPLKPFETLATVGATAQSIYVGQIED
jgi:hypothetical protein